MRDCPKLTCPDTAEDVVDPDMHGIGIIISFVVTAGFALLIAVVAIVRGGIHDCYYSWLDEKLLSKLPTCFAKLPKETPDNLGYQAFLLSLSDQTLMTGICYAIAMDIRTCELSVFSFQVGLRLICIASTVHLATLAVLKPHFLEHQCQEIVRCGLMVLFLVLYFVTVVREARTQDYAIDSSFICTSDEQFSFTTEASSAATILGALLAYLNAIGSIKPRKNKFTPTFWTTGVLKVICSICSGIARVDVKTYLLQKRAKATFVEQSKIHALRQKPNFFKVVYIIVPILLWEIFDSIFFELLLAAVWFGYYVHHLSVLLRTEEVDIEKIMSLGFGQIMPVLLLLVFAVTALEVGSIKQHHNAATKRASSTSETTPNPDATPVQQDHSSGRVSLAADNDEQDISQAPYLHPEANRSAADIASTTGLIRTDSLPESLGTPSRTNTLKVEEGSHQSAVYTSEHPVHVIEVGIKHTPLATWVSLGIAGLLFVAVIVLSYKFYPWVDLALETLVCGLFFGELALDVTRVHQKSDERRRNKDRANAHLMDGLLAQNGSTQGGSRGTGVDLGRPPVWRPSY